MKEIRNKCLIFFESIPANLVTNLLTAIVILLLVEHKTALFISPIFLITNTLWITFYLVFAYTNDHRIFSISGKGRFLVAYFILFFLITCFFWMPHASRKMYVTLVFLVNAASLAMFLFYVLLKRKFVNKFNNADSALLTHKIFARLQSIIGTTEFRNNNYKVNNNQGNHEHVFTYNTKNKILSLSWFSGKPKIGEEKLPEITPYTLSDVSIGDTLADWAISRTTINFKGTKVRQLNNRILKRGLDIIISLIAIIFFLSWMMPLIGLLIKLESRGPILFKQLRSGLNNKPFWCYKFRSMYENRESDEVQATKKDQRITKMGMFLRKTSIDEFPQFINVLKGEMSIVGPRPHMLLHTEIYSKQIKNYMNRLSLKQGLTGLAQVNGFRGETSDIKFMESRIEHDLWYAENWSIWLDIKIIFLTIFKVFKADETAF